MYYKVFYPCQQNGLCTPRMRNRLHPYLIVESINKIMRMIEIAESFGMHGAINNLVILFGYPLGQFQLFVG